MAGSTSHASIILKDRSVSIWLFKLVALFVAGSLFVWVLNRWIIDGRERSARRAAFLDEAKSVFADGTKRIVETGLPRMSGTYLGHSFDLQVVPDTLNFRKLPALWVLVTLTEPQLVAATIDMMMRPRGIEPFSNFSSLPVHIETPAGFPADCSVRTDSSTGLPDLAAMRRHSHLLDDKSYKELVISPKGLRLVILAEEADRSRYLLFRDSEMGVKPLPADRLKSTMDKLIALSQELSITTTVNENA